MASLYSQLRAGKLSRAGVDSDLHEHYWGRLMPFLLDHTRAPNCILVNIQSVIDDIVQAGEGNFAQVQVIRKLDFIQQATPPFPSMWLEGRYKDRGGFIRVGFLLVRNRLDVVSGARNNPCPFVVTISEWPEANGGVMSPPWVVRIGLDEGGNFIDHGLQVFGRPMEGTDADNNIHCALSVAAHALMRMNCRKLRT